MEHDEQLTLHAFMALDADGDGAISRTELEPLIHGSAKREWVFTTFAGGMAGLSLRAFRAFAAGCLKEDDLSELVPAWRTGEPEAPLGRHLRALD